MRTVLAVLVVLAAGCAGDDISAGVACEGFIDQRVGAAVEHADFRDAEAADLGDGRWQVTSTFVDTDGAPTAYRCVVERGDEGGWLLAELTTDR